MLPILGELKIPKMPLENTSFKQSGMLS